MKVFSNTAISLDGRINTKEGGFRFFGSPRDHARMSRLRAEADAILVGGATFRNWPHPSLPDDVDRTQAHRPWWNVVVTRTLDVPLDAGFLAEPAVRPLFLTRADSLRAGFAAEAEGWSGPGSSLPVAWILAQLERRGVERLLVEAGGDLLFQFLAADAIDEMNLTLCPLVAGGPAPGLVGGPGFDFAAARRFRLEAAVPEGDEVFLRYAAVHRQEAR
ncbi:MAG TPA: RibD family protein [Caldimonas sp.]|nr:RibD family protein [Caldimonas sp.]